MKTITVIKSHKSSYPNPISFEKGDPLSVGRRDDEYDGWVRVTTMDGNEGWAPEQYVKLFSGQWVAIENYNAKELNTTVGEKLLILRELNEWAWVKNSDEMCGWIPLEKTD